MASRCYIRPLDAYYLGEACLLFNELDADGSGALDASEFDASEFCQVAWEDNRDLGFESLEELTEQCEACRAGGRQFEDWGCSSRA